MTDKEPTTSPDETESMDENRLEAVAMLEKTIEDIRDCKVEAVFIGVLRSSGSEEMWNYSSTSFGTKGGVAVMRDCMLAEREVLAESKSRESMN